MNIHVPVLKMEIIVIPKIQHTTEIQTFSLFFICLCTTISIYKNSSLPIDVKYMQHIIFILYF